MGQKDMERRMESNENSQRRRLILRKCLETIKTAYIGHDWVKELVDPAATMIYQHETQALYDLLDFDATSLAGAAQQMPVSGGAMGK